jgi:hypothetical protein
MKFVVAAVVSSHSRSESDNTKSPALSAVYLNNIISREYLLPSIRDINNIK